MYCCVNYYLFLVVYDGAGGGCHGGAGSGCHGGNEGVAGHSERQKYKFLPTYNGFSDVNIFKM